MTTQPQAKVEPVVYLLTGLVVFFTGALFAAEFWFRQDAVFFQAIAGLLTTAAGALFMKIKTDTSPVPAPGTTTVTDTRAREVTQTPPDPPPATDVKLEDQAK